MALLVKELRIYLFDLHLSPAPLADPSLLKQELSFLVEPRKYQKRQEMKGFFEIEGFRVRPLRSELEWNYFWCSYYNGVWLPKFKKNLRWYHHLPFLCFPISSSLSISLEEYELETVVKPVVLLWSFGWSTTLQFTVRADLSFDQMQKLMAAIQHRSPAPFRIDSTELVLSGVFKWLADKVCKALYLDSHPTGHSLKIARNKVLAIIQQSETPRPYAKMDDIEKQHLHGALLGKKVSLRQYTELRDKRDKNDGFLITPLKGIDFAFTHFEEGTLLSLADAYASGRETPRALRCLVANITSCSQTTLALAHFIREAKNSEIDHVKGINEIVTTAQAILRQLPERYDNPFCDNFMFANNTVYDATKN